MNNQKAIKEKQKQDIFDIAYKQAEKHNLVKEFTMAYEEYDGDAMMALEDWDLLDKETIEKIIAVKEEQ